MRIIQYSGQVRTVSSSYSYSARIITIKMRGVKSRSLRFNVQGSQFRVPGLNPEPETLNSEPSSGLFLSERALLSFQCLLIGAVWNIGTQGDCLLVLSDRIRSEFLEIEYAGEKHVTPLDQPAFGIL